MRRGKRRAGLIVAMDGPAGVGKSTVGHLVAKTLGYAFVNSGEMYRALTWKALEQGVRLDDPRAVLALARRLSWEFRPVRGSAALRTFLDGRPVAAQIREERVSANSSRVAAIPGVRRFLSRLQRGLGARGAIVMEGRDIATHVFPDADVKVYLDASPLERAARRCRQLRAAGQPADKAKILAAIRSRDRRDRRRRINPLRRAPGALAVDSTRLTLRQVAERVLRHVRTQARGHGR